MALHANFGARVELWFNVRLRCEEEHHKESNDVSVSAVVVGDRMF